MTCAFCMLHVCMHKTVIHSVISVLCIIREDTVALSGGLSDITYTGSCIATLAICNHVNEVI